MSNRNYRSNHFILGFEISSELILNKMPDLWIFWRGIAMCEILWTIGSLQVLNRPWIWIQSNLSQLPRKASECASFQFHGGCHSTKVVVYNPKTTPEFGNIAPDSRCALCKGASFHLHKDDATSFKWSASQTSGWRNKSQESRKESLIGMWKTADSRVARIDKCWL